MTSKFAKSTLLAMAGFVSLAVLQTTAFAQNKCWDTLAQKDKEYAAVNLRPLPQGSTPGLQRVMWMTADSINVIDANCAGDAKAAQYRSELERAYNQAKTACGQLSAGGQCQANAY
jgi:hypothetical protein